MTLPKVSSGLAKTANAIYMYKGESRAIEISVTKEIIEDGVQTEVPVDMDDAGLVFTVRRAIGDVSVILEKRSGNSGEIEPATPTNLGKSVLYLVPDDTRLLDAGNYVFDIWVEMDDGSRYPVVEVAEFRLLEPVGVK